MTFETAGAEDRAALRRLADAYAIAMDQADLAAFPGLFVPDGVLIVRRPGRDKPMGVFRGPGPDGIGLIALLMHEHYRSTMHHITTHDARIDGDEATGTTLCLAYHIADGADGADGTTLETLGVRYQDAFVRTPDGWRFSSRDATRVWSQTTAVPAGPLIIDRVAGAQHKR